MLQKCAVEMLLRGDERVIAAEDGPVLLDLIAFEVERCVVRGDRGVFESEVGVVDEEDASDLELAVEDAYLLLEFVEGEVAAGDVGRVGSIFGPLKYSHGENSVEAAESCKVGGAGVEESDPWVAIHFGALLETPAIDVHADDGGVGQVFGEGEDFFSGGAAEGEDGGGGDVLEMLLAGGEEFGIAIGLGVCGALVVRVSVEGAGDLLGSYARVEDESPDGAEGAESVGERSE